MLDLVGQYRRLQRELDAEMQSVLQGGDFIQGSAVKLLEQELSDFLRVPHVISCGNGTDALQLAFMSLNLPKGSEIIIPSFAYAALAEVILLLDLVPVFVEVDEQLFVMKVSEIESKITDRTKAIAPVHLFGCMADMDAIMDIASQHDLFVVEDAAQAIGSYYHGERYQGFAGCIGTVGTTSFFPSKNLGCFGDGGAVFCSDEALALRIRQLANHGQSKKYIHDQVGINSRLDTLQAAVLRVKLRHLSDFTQKRQATAEYYCEHLRQLDEQGWLKLPLMEGDTALTNVSKSSHVFHQFTLRLGTYEKREALRQFLSAQGIATMVYYPLPLHRQTAYFQSIELPITEHLCNTVLSIPICPELGLQAKETVVKTIKDFFTIS